MEQKKVTKSERDILKKMSVVGSYIVVGDWRRSNCEVKMKGETFPVISFRESMRLQLQDKGLLDIYNNITQKGGEAAVKGFYTE